MPENTLNLPPFLNPVVLTCLYAQDMYACDTPWKTVDFAATYMAKLQGDGLDPNALPYAMSLVRVCSWVRAGVRELHFPC